MAFETYPAFRAFNKISEKHVSFFYRSYSIVTMFIMLPSSSFMWQLCYLILVIALWYTVFFGNGNLVPKWAPLDFCILI